MNKQIYQRLAIMPLCKGMDLIKAELESAPKKTRTDVMGFGVHLTSIRLRTFHFSGSKCVCCGLQASHFAIEKQLHNKTALHPHMNLYGLTDRGEEILFTKDHIVSKKDGGRDILSNMQTMCQPCNNLKAGKSLKY